MHFTIIQSHNTVLSNHIPEYTRARIDIIPDRLYNLLTPPHTMDKPKTQVRYDMFFLFLIIITLFLLLGILFFMVKPAKRRNSELFSPGLFAHRGIHSESAPENSIPAFRHAAQLGYGIELDIRLTKDSVPVVFHDRTLERLCGDKRKISRLTASELKNLRLSGTDEGIPLLSEVIDAFPDTPLICEIKTDSLKDTRACFPASQLLAKRTAPTAVQSFNPFALRKFKKLAPSVLRGQLSGKERNPIAFLVRSQLLNFISRPDFASYNINSRRSLFLRLCRKKLGLRLILWTSRTPSPIEDVDGIIFDR